MQNILTVCTAMCATSLSQLQALKPRSCLQERKYTPASFTHPFGTEQCLATHVWDPAVIAPMHQLPCYQKWLSIGLDICQDDAARREILISSLASVGVSVCNLSDGALETGDVLRRRQLEKALSVSG